MRKRRFIVKASRTGDFRRRMSRATKRGDDFYRLVAVDNLGGYVYCESGWNYPSPYDPQLLVIAKSESDAMRIFEKYLGSEEIEFDDDNFVVRAEVLDDGAYNSFYDSPDNAIILN